MKQLTAFSWGYWGWGTHVPEFITTVDAIERARGHRPPIFADIRFSRSVRATGFRDAAFEEEVGQSRYRWLRTLGNKRIGTGRKGIAIADPSSVVELLQLVRDADRERRRVIFFCSCPCERPCDCHRSTVAHLLVKAARRDRLPLTVVEWPGDDPKIIEHPVADKVIKDVIRGGGRVPLSGERPADILKWAALPWCSRVALRSDDADLAVISGPAQLATGWYLPVIGPEVSKAADTVESLKKTAVQQRKSLGFLPVVADRAGSR